MNIKEKIILLSLSLFTGTVSFSQTKREEAKFVLVGINAVPFVSNSIDLFSESMLSKYMSLGFNAGYTYGPGLTVFKLDDGFERELKGGSFKVCPRYNIRANRNVVAFGIGYVGSLYNEEGIRKEYDPVSGQLEVVEVRRENGYTSGMIITGHLDHFLKHNIGFRIGIQKGISFRRDYIGSELRTYQPGLGYKSLFYLFHQGTIGLFYNFKKSQRDL